MPWTKALFYNYLNYSTILLGIQKKSFKSFDSQHVFQKCLKGKNCSLFSKYIHTSRYIPAAEMGHNFKTGGPLELNIYEPTVLPEECGPHQFRMPVDDCIYCNNGFVFLIV